MSSPFRVVPLTPGHDVIHEVSSAAELSSGNTAGGRWEKFTTTNNGSPSPSQAQPLVEWPANGIAGTFQPANEMAETYATTYMHIHTLTPFRVNIILYVLADPPHCAGLVIFLRCWSMPLAVHSREAWCSELHLLKTIKQLSSQCHTVDWSGETN